MANESLLKTMRDLGARVDGQLQAFDVAVNEEEPKKRSVGKYVAGAVAGGAAGAAYGIAKDRPDLVGKAKSKVANGLGKANNRVSGVAAKINGAGTSPLRKAVATKVGSAGEQLGKLGNRLRRLNALADEQLHQFDLDPEDYVGERTERKKKKQAVRAGMATAAVAGGVAAAGMNRDKLKEAGKTAAFRGTRKVAGAVNKAGNVANQVANRLPNKPGASVKNIPGNVAVITGKKLKKGAKSLRKASMKLFSRSDIDRLVKALV